MTGFEFAKEYNTIDEKMIVLFMDATKMAYKMSGVDFDSLPMSERESILTGIINKFTA